MYNSSQFLIYFAILILVQNISSEYLLLFSAVFFSLHLGKVGSMSILHSYSQLSLFLLLSNELTYFQLLSESHYHCYAALFHRFKHADFYILREYIHCHQDLPLVCVCQTASDTPQRPGITKNTASCLGSGFQSSTVIIQLVFRTAAVDLEGNKEEKYRCNYNQGRLWQITLFYSTPNESTRQS